MGSANTGLSLKRELRRHFVRVRSKEIYYNSSQDKTVSALLQGHNSALKG